MADMNQEQKLYVIFATIEAVLLLSKNEACTFWINPKLNIHSIIIDVLRCLNLFKNVRFCFVLLEPLLFNSAKRIKHK